MTAQIRVKVEKLVKAGNRDENSLFEEVMKKPRIMKDALIKSGIDMDLMEVTVKDQIKEVLLREVVKPEKKGLFSKILGR
ncbi:hypothetical protein M0R04_08110 [Candidatus Dojkabacteria bacterium]|jgi:ketol-acid reductoisomerase|nr:hypothetical protein [Candidatus Dojkabacteria bacterium]